MQFVSDTSYPPNALHEQLHCIDAAYAAAAAAVAYAAAAVATAYAAASAAAAAVAASAAAVNSIALSALRTLDLTITNVAKRFLRSKRSNHSVAQQPICL